MAILALLVLAFACVRATMDDGPVCGANGKNYQSKDAAQADGTHVLHCGECGACSNLHDISIYYNTRNNLTVTTR